MASKFKITPTFSAPVSQSTSQLKKILASPKKDPIETNSSNSNSTSNLILQASPPSIESTGVADSDDFLHQLSQNTNSFHAATHFGGRPISPLPPRINTTPSPLNEDTNKTRVLSQVLSIGSNTNSQSTKTKRLSGSNGSNNNNNSHNGSTNNGTITGIAMLGNKYSDGFLTDGEITAQATSQNGFSNNNNNQQQQQQQSQQQHQHHQHHHHHQPQHGGNGGGKIGSAATLSSSLLLPTTTTSISSSTTKNNLYELLAPSDFTGKKPLFTKLK